MIIDSSELMFRINKLFIGVFSNTRVLVLIRKRRSDPVNIVDPTMIWIFPIHTS